MILDFEKDLNDNLQTFLEKFIPVFSRIQHYEEVLQEGAVETPATISEAMKELVSLYSTLNSATALLQAKTAVYEAKSYIVVKENAERLAMKVTERYLNSQVDVTCEPYHRAVAIFTSCRDNCDRIISVLQSSLKHTERENALTKHS